MTVASPPPIRRASSLPRLVGIELRLLRHERALWGLLALMLAAMVLAALAGADRVRAERAAVDTARHEESLARAKARRIAAGPPPPEQFRNPADPYGYLYYFLRAYAVAPSKPLAPLAAGAADSAPPVRAIGPNRPFADGAAGIANPLVARLGRFDLAFVFVFLMPLALIPIAGTRLSLERDRGQMPLLNAQPVSPRRRALAKYAAVALLMLPPLLAGFWGAVALSGADLAASLPAMAALSGAILLYGLFWIALAALIQRFRPGVAASLGALVLLWVVLGFLLPLLGGLALDRAAPQADRVGQILAAREAAARFDADPEGATRRWLTRTAPALSSANKDPDPARATARGDLRRLAQDALIDEAVRPYEAAARTRTDFGQRWADRLRSLSPSLLLDAQFQRAAGTDAPRLRAAARAADRASACLSERFRPLILSTETSGDSRTAPIPAPARVKRYEHLVQSCTETNRLPNDA